MTQSCLHCGSPAPSGGPAAAAFCCRGCEAAYALVKDAGLASYYARRCVDPAIRPLKPDEDTPSGDLSVHVRVEDDGLATLHLMVEGLHCAACVWLIESLLSRQPGVVQARVNMTTRRLVLRWRADENDANAIAAPVTAIGYRLIPYDPARLGDESRRLETELMRAMAVAGFAAANVMLLSVSVWAGHWEGMGPATRGLMHWVSALIALPAIAYSIRPFARSALAAVRGLRTNMDVPITLGVLLASGMSLVETVRGGEHAYFDSAITLLFFLLIGRYLDSRARGRARSAAEHLLALSAVAVTVLDEAGHAVMLPPGQLRQGMVALVAAGERIGVDGTILDGASDLDTSLISGETIPVAATVGERVFAGTINLSGPLRVTVTAVGEETLLAEIVRLMESAEQGRARYVALADRVARLYAPVVHTLALATFLGWTVFGGLDWQIALLYAVAVLIITCPCALALAVPVVQVIATGRLLRRGILVKSPTALERMAVADTVVFDKTGTLTLGRPHLLPSNRHNDEELRQAASLAAASRHPLARALAREAPGVPVAEGVAEHPGQGLSAGEIRLGSRRWCGVAEDDSATAGPELWLARPGVPPVRFAFADEVRSDAHAVIAELTRLGFRIELLSGDRPAAVAAVAERLGLSTWKAACSPAEKCARMAELAGQGRRVMMVGDGLNDAPALAAALVSLSPSTAVDVSQTAADAIFQGDRLGPVTEVLAVARKAERLVKQNFALAFLYNVITVPLAVAGMVTPLIAAIAMSTSSLLVIANAMRLARPGGKAA